MKQLEISNFLETLDFGNTNGHTKLDEYHFRLYKNSSTIAFNSYVSKLIRDKKLMYLLIQRDPINDTLFFNFINTPTKLKVSKITANSKTLGVSCKPLYEMLCSRFNLQPTTGGLIAVTKNKSKRDTNIFIQLDPQPEQ